jgi:hypothetical protein
VTKWTKSLLPAALFLIQSFVSVGRANADPITYLQTGGTPSETVFLFTEGGPIIASPQLFAVSFTLDHPLQGISISVPQFRIEQEGFTGTAWITNALGPGATAANVLATNQLVNQFSPQYPDYASFTFFSGLNLDPGTYSFFISSPNCDAIHPCHGSFPHGYGVASWLGYYPGEVQSADGVHYDGSFTALGHANTICDSGLYDPANGCNINYDSFVASNWQPTGIKMSFAITQTVAEPSSLALCSICLPLLWIFRRRRLAS